MADQLRGAGGLYVYAHRAVRDYIIRVGAARRDKIDICMMDVQRQEGTFECRLFAVAFTALANGIKPGKLKFKQDSCTGVSTRVN